MNQTRTKLWPRRDIRGSIVVAQATAGARSAAARLRHAAFV
ncbi:hypothetical protein BURMUCF1_A1977 [Burkholderia multivorans ATCC BAA-247]|nr:hypothetical protein BURMUCF1_A1977 [Burkholderia multivorans ATCC BAA-247]